MLRHTPHAVPKRKRILELNPSHPIVQRLEKRFSTSSDDPVVGDMAELLLGSALLAEGSELPDPARFNQLLTQLMETKLGMEAATQQNGD
jgi:molecular chaperone HtpG